MSGENETVKINMALPPDVHPAVMSGEAPNLVNAMTRAYEVCTKITNAAAELDNKAKGERPRAPGKQLSGTERYEHQREVDAYIKRTSVFKEDLAREVEPMLEKAAATFDKALASAAMQIGALNEEIEKTLVPGTVTTPYHGEIRAALGKKPSIAKLNEAIETGDKDIIAAVIGSPLMLLGITQETHDVLKTKAINMLCKEKGDKMKAVQSDLRKAMNARDVFFKDVAGKVSSWRSAEQKIIKNVLGEIS